MGETDTNMTNRIFKSFMLIGNAEFDLILWHTSLLEACLKPRKMKAKVQSKNIQLNHCMKTADPIYLLLCESFIKWVRSRLQQSVTIIANLQTKSSLRPRGRVQLPPPWGGLATSHRQLSQHWTVPPLVYFAEYGEGLLILSMGVVKDQPGVKCCQSCRRSIAMLFPTSECECVGGNGH